MTGNLGKGGGTLPPHSLLGRLDRGARWLSIGGAILGAAGVVAMILVGAADTIGSLFDRPILASVEIIQALLAPSILLSLGFAALQGQHIKVDLLLESLPNWARHMLMLMAMVLTLLVFCFVGWLAWDQGLHAMSIREVSAGYVPIPIWISKVFVAIGVTIAAIECLRQLLWLCVGVEAVERDTDNPEETPAAF